MTFRSALLSIAACAAVPLAGAAVQLPGPIPREKEPPSQQTRMQEKRLPLTVNGCIRGKRLVLSTMSAHNGIIDLLNANDLLLEGPKELLTQLRREHENHDDEFTGIASCRRLPTAPPRARGRRKNSARGLASRWACARAAGPPATSGERCVSASKRSAT